MRTVQQTVFDNAVVVRTRARRILVLGTVFANLLLVAAPGAVALNPDRRISQYAHTAWRLRDGTFPGTPTAITQTTDGYVWIGTLAGLLRFDGVRFVTFAPPAGKQLPSPAVTSLLGATDGSLWIGTAAGLAQWKNGELFTFPKTAGKVESIYEDRDGAIWMARSRTDEAGGVCKIAESVATCYAPKDGVPPYAEVLIRDNLGFFLIGHSTGIVRWKPGSSTSYDLPGLKSKPGLTGISGLALAPDGSVWVGMSWPGHGLGLERWVHGSWRPLVTPTLDSSRLRVKSLWSDRNNTLWIGTYETGIYRVHEGNADHFASADGLSGDTVESFFEDREGNLWVATAGGVDCFRNLPIVSFSVHEGLSADNVESILAARDGTVWIGNHGALDRVRGTEVSSIGPKEGFRGNQVTALFEDHTGRLWVGLDNGLLVYEHGRVTPVHRSDGGAIGIVLAMTEDIDHNVWASVIRNPPGRPTKLICFRDGRFVKEISDLGRDVVSLAADPHGGFWLGLSQGGLARYRSDQVQVFPLKDANARVSQVLANSDGSVLAATSNGLVERRGDSQHTLDGNNGLPCNRIYALVTDKHSDLWLYAACGVIEIKSDDLQRWREHADQKVKFNLFDAFDGAQPYLPPFRPVATRSNDGRLWFTNDTLAQMIDPDGPLTNPIPPPVHIEDVLADRKAYTPQSGLRLPALTRDLEIDYTALSFVVPQKVHFQYKLEGYDRNWQDAGTRRQAFYSNLPPRKYTFRVKASNNDALWNEAGASLDFLVAPAYYQTNWFRFLCIAALIALLWALHRWRVHRLTSQEKHLREAVETIPAMTFTTSSDGSNTFVNKRWIEYTGLSVEKTSGAGWQRAIHPEDLAHHSEKWSVSVATGHPFECEGRFRRAIDGEYRWFLVRGVPLRDQHGKIVRWYGTLTDIEDSKRAGEALLRSELYLREGQSLAHTGSWAFNADGFDYWSSELFRIYGLEPSGKPPTIEEYLALVHPEDRAFMKQGIAKMLDDHLAFDFTKRIVRPDGEIRHVRCVGVSVTQGGIFQGFVGTGMDVTEQEQLTQELRLNEYYLSEGERLAHTGSWTYNPSGFFDYWSQELFNIYGLDPQKGAPTLEQYLAIVHPADRDFIAETIRRMHADRCGCDVTKRIVRPDGEQRYTRWVGIPVVEGEVLKGFLGTAMDITEQQLLTQELERQQAHLTEAQKLSHTGSWVFHPDREELLYCSDEFFRIFGFDPQEGMPTSEQLRNRIHPEDRDRAREKRRKRFRERQEFVDDYRVVLPDGTEKDVHIIGHPVLDGNGKLVEYVGTAMDITDRKRAQQALQRSEAYLAEAQKLTHTGSWTWRFVDRKMKTEHLSEEWYRIYGFDPDEGAPTLEGFSERVHPEDRLKWKGAIERAIAEKADYDHTFRILSPNGMVKWIHSVGHPVVSAAGDLEQFVGSTTDITELKSAEQEREKLRQLEADLAHINRVSTLGEMAASLAHEIKQPIAAAITSANSCVEWLSHDPPNLDRARAAAARIDKYGNRAAEIIDRIRSFYKKSPPQRELVDVNRIIQEILTLLDGEATRSSVVVRTQLAADLPEIMADRVQLQQVFMNLMLNGIEAMTDSRGQLTVKSELHDGQVQFSVSDTGVGLPAEKMDKIFSAFFTTKPQGSGMGLAISRSIVESHGGRLWAISNSGRGATFHFTLPTQMTDSSPLAG